MNTPGRFSNIAKTKLKAAVRSALIEIKRRVIAEIRESISTPVTRISGHHSDVIRSEPGEAPYREFGTLWRSIQGHVAPNATGLDDLTVYTNLLRAIWLELGRLDGHFEARPFWEPARRRINRYIMSLFKKLVAENLRKNSKQTSDEE